MALDQVRPDVRPHSAEFGDAADQLPAGKVDVVDRQHGREFQLIGTVLAEFVNPVVVGLADRQRDQRIQAFPGRDGEAGGWEQNGDVGALNLHRHDLRHRVEIPLKRKIQAIAVFDPGAGQRLFLGDFPNPGTRGGFAVFLVLVVPKGRDAVDGKHASAFRLPL